MSNVNSKQAELEAELARVRAELAAEKRANKKAEQEAEIREDLNGKSHIELVAEAASTVFRKEPAKAALLPESELREELVMHRLQRSTSKSGKMAALKAARLHYKPTKTKDGKTRLDNNDAVAKALRGLEPEEVCVVADKVRNEAAGTHAKRYGHLNKGQMRMNAGNRVRGAMKVDGATQESVLKAIADVKKAR